MLENFYLIFMLWILSKKVNIKNRNIDTFWKQIVEAYFLSKINICSTYILFIYIKIHVLKYIIFTLFDDLFK